MFISTLHFLFPTHPYKATVVEEMFADQLATVRAAGFSASLCPESAIKAGKPLRDVPAGATVVYRGWMLNPAEYGRLAQAITAASASPLTSPEAYLAAHYLPNWYPLIADDTPETRVLPLTADFEAELRAIGWDAFFVKDYVKSLKTSRGSIIHNPAEIGPVIEEMKQFRGDIEGGLCVRRVESFVADSERRYFVIDGQPFAANGMSIPAIVERVASHIPSPFFSIDVAERTDGVLRVIEVGDGQVSDLVGWSAAEFAFIWKTIAAR